MGKSARQKRYVASTPMVRGRSVWSVHNQRFKPVNALLLSQRRGPGGHW